MCQKDNMTAAKRMFFSGKTQKYNYKPKITKKANQEYILSMKYIYLLTKPFLNIFSW